MSKLKYKVGTTTKEFVLSDSANKPRLCVKVGTTIKYLPLKVGSRSGELNVKIGTTKYKVYTLLDYTKSSPVQSTNMTFYIAQSTADGYGWLTNDVARNVALCKMYGLTYGQSGLNYASARPYYVANGDLAMFKSLSSTGRINLYFPSSANAHNYVSNSWGGTGPHRMYAKIDGVTIEEHPYYHVVTRPFYFLYSDNNLKFYDHGSSDRAGDILLYDVLKNGVSTKDLRSTSTPTLFEEGDTIAVIAYFGGYNTRSTFQPTITYNPTVRWAEA